jgi:hypothetical protein
MWIIKKAWNGETCPMWHQVGGGYSSERNGWVDASEFIDKYK